MSERLTMDHLYETISDPDANDWFCPTCGYRNIIFLSVKECERCGFELDPDRVEDAVSARISALEGDDCCPGCGACPGFTGVDCDETCEWATTGGGAPTWPNSTPGPDIMPEDV